MRASKLKFTEFAVHFTRGLLYSIPHLTTCSYMATAVPRSKHTPPFRKLYAFLFLYRAFRAGVQSLLHYSRACCWLTIFSLSVESNSAYLIFHTDSKRRVSPILPMKPRGFLVQTSSSRSSTSWATWSSSTAAGSYGARTTGLSSSHS